MQTGLFTGTVMHQRLRPRRHRFAYRCLWLMIDLADPPPLLRLLSFGRFNLFSFHECDHAAGTVTPLGSAIRALAGQHGIAAEGRILLLTTPRILGRGFNPLSIFFCHDRAGNLSGIVWEVSSTFGERHSYVLPVGDCTDGTVRQSCDKVMHVSPFLPMDLQYHFRVQLSGPDLTVAIADHDRDGPVLIAAMRLSHQPLTDRALLSALAGTVVFPFKTLIAIHWEALRLAAKRLRLFRHPGFAKAISLHSAGPA